MTPLSRTPYIIGAHALCSCPLGPGAYPVHPCSNPIGPSQHNSHLHGTSRRPNPTYTSPNTRAPSCYFMLCRGGPYARIVVLAELKTPQMLAANTEGSGFAIRDDQINNFILYQLQKGWCFCSKWIVGRSETHRGPLYSLLMTINCRIQSAPC